MRTSRDKLFFWLWRHEMGQRAAWHEIFIDKLYTRGNILW